MSNAEIETVTATSDALTPDHPAIAYCQGTPLRNEIEAQDASRLDLVTWNAADAIAQKFGDGPVSAKIQTHIITAVA